MQFDKGSLESYNIATNAGLKQSNFLTWAGIRSAIPGHLKFLDDNSRKTGLLEFCCGEKVFDPVLCKSKQFYEFLIAKKGIVSRGFTKLKNDFDLDDITVSKVFLNLLSVSSETFIRSFLITLAKLHIWQSQKQDKIPESEVFLKQVDVKYRTEKYIAVKNNTQKQFQAKWLLYRWHLFIINNSLQI